MDFGVREGVAGFLLFIHFCIAFMLTIELNNILIFSKPKKFMWYLFVWLVPFIGSALAHKHFKIGWAKGSGSGSGNDGGFGGYDG